MRTPNPAFTMFPTVVNNPVDPLVRLSSMLVVLFLAYAQRALLLSAAVVSHERMPFGRHNLEIGSVEGQKRR